MTAEKGAGILISARRWRGGGLSWEINTDSSRYYPQSQDGYDNTVKKSVGVRSSLGFIYPHPGILKRILFIQKGKEE